jgi:hypothetical protein
MARSVLNEAWDTPSNIVVLRGGEEPVKSMRRLESGLACRMRRGDDPGSDLFHSLDSTTW